MELFLEVLKYTIPALVVFATAYYLLKLLLDERERIDRAILRQDAQKITLPLRLQAYERLTLLCDRADILSALIRVRTPGMKVRDLRTSMMLAISQEFDHNTSQQVYVSETLWQILTVAKSNTLELVTQTASDLDPNDNAQLLSDAFVAAIEGQESTALQKAMIAIRIEASRLY